MAASGSEAMEVYSDETSVAEPAATRSEVGEAPPVDHDEERSVHSPSTEGHTSLSQSGDSGPASEEYDGLKLHSIERSEPDDPDLARIPDMDVIHVLGVDTNRVLSGIVPSWIKSQRREFVFSNGAIFLADDPDMIMEIVEGEARRLLRGLKHFGQLSKRAIVFVAYDLGALVVKKAILIAESEPGEWGDVLIRAARFVFHGCFQFGNDEEELATKMMKFVHGGNSDIWIQLLTPGTVKHLATTTMEVNNLFLASKVTLRSRIFSLYAAEEESETIHQVFDRLTATMGIPTELSVRLETEDPQIPFRSLNDKIYCNAEGWLPEPSLAAIQCTLASIVPQQDQMISAGVDAHHGVRLSSSHRTWSTRNGVRVLYIHGPDVTATEEAAEQVGLGWVAKDQAKFRYNTRPFLFRFSARDPARDSIRHMVAASLLQSLSDTSDPDVGSCVDAQALMDQWKLHRTWTDQDLITIISYANTWLASHAPYILLELDECEHYGRMAFWSFLSEAGKTSEEPLKVVVTSRRPGALSKELGHFPGITVDEYTVSPSPEASDSVPDVDHQEAMVHRLCPRRLGEDRVRKSLDKLVPMDRAAMNEVVGLISRRTQWPEVVTSKNLATFCGLLEDVSPETTPTMMLSHILKCTDDQAGLRWILGWLLCGYRPLEPGELATMLCYGRQCPRNRTSLPSDGEVKAARSDVRAILKGIAAWSNNQVQIRPEILSLMDRDDDKIWTNVRMSAPGATLAFLLEYLALAHTQFRLEKLYSQYLSRVESAGVDEMVPPLVPNGQESQDIIFYAVQALPYHLDASDVDPETVEKMKDPRGPFSAWSKVYWAMGNTFCRPPEGPFCSAWKTWRSGPQSTQPSLVGSIDTHSDTNAEVDDVRAGGANGKTLSLIEAVRANNEDSAIHLAKELIADRENAGDAAGTDPGQTIAWPSSVLWRATWLDMRRLMTVLLQNGADVHDSSSSFSPSLIYMASRLGHAELVALLLRHGADVTVLKKDKYSPVHTAAANGRVGALATILAERGALMNVEQPNRPLYAASIWGCWPAAEFLLKFPEANPDLREEQFAIGWTPLAGACDEGHVETVRVLLAHGADPNIQGPGKDFTALWYAAVRHGNIDIVRMLLERGAIPDHDSLPAPLMCGMFAESELLDEEKLALCDVLIQNEPPANINEADPEGKTPLMIAAQKGDVSSIAWLLKHGSDINRTDKQGYHALFYAVESRHMAAVHELLAHEPAPTLDIQDNDGRSLLGLAAAGPDAEKSGGLLETLLGAGASLEFENRNKQTVFSIAVDDGQMDMVKLLLGRNADINHRDVWGWNPLFSSIAFTPKPDMLRVLVDGGASLTETLSDGTTALHLAMEQANPDMLRILLEFRTSADIKARTATGSTPLLAVTKWGDPGIVECLRLLVRAGADINEKDSKERCLLMRSSYEGQSARAIHEFILSLQEADVNIVSPEFGTPLQVAAASRNRELLHDLIDRGADVNLAVPGFAPTALISGCMPWQRDVEQDEDPFESAEWVVRELVAHGAEVDWSGSGTVGIFNALSAASLSSGVGAINFLLDAGASVQKRDPIGRLPIHFAAANGLRNFEVVSVAYTGDLLAADHTDKNALHWAAQFGHVETLKSILKRLPAMERKASINARDKDGWTPLAWAMRPLHEDTFLCWHLSERRNYVDTVRYLVEQGADVSAKLQIGQGQAAEILEPAELARRCGADELAQLLDHSENPPAGPEEGSKEDDGAAKSLKDHSNRYVQRDFACDACLASIYGCIYKCDNCPSVHVCNKCHGRIHLYHLVDGEQPHTFSIDDSGAEEFEQPASPSSRASSRGRENRLKTDEDTANGDEDRSVLQGSSPQEEGTEVLDFADLRDLGSFADLDDL